MAVRKRLPCQGDCNHRTEHEHQGRNIVGRDVWQCVECRGTRAGPILSKREVEQPIATDGGTD